MATYFGGETLLEVKTVNAAAVSNGTYYTVPANRYAEIFVQEFWSSAGGSLFMGSIRQETASGNHWGISIPFSGASFPHPRVITLFQGQSISSTCPNNNNYYFVVKEYAIP